MIKITIFAETAILKDRAPIPLASSHLRTNFSPAGVRSRLDSLFFLPSFERRIGSSSKFFQFFKPYRQLTAKNNGPFSRTFLRILSSRFRCRTEFEVGTFTREQVRIQVIENFRTLFLSLSDSYYVSHRIKMMRK